jgi:triacylglycerol esterase/lipase EstA (alpha/beta hydrolase family)
MADQPKSPSYQRYHIVLIPGFGGFDALGQVEYYSGITDLFQRWKQARGRAAKPVVLHYFDNFPTAAVVTRADRLRQYLAKRFARGEILPDDEVALVGHSTGGLDIRQLVCNLDHARADRIYVDGGHEVSLPDLRRCLRRVVFLSVPHWGTNIADWVHSHPGWRRLVVANIRVAVAGSQVYRELPVSLLDCQKN